MVTSAFLRSINIQLDIGHPERLEHFRPSSKSVRLVSSLLQDEVGSALFVVAPYGSGKSITAAYIGELVENHPRAEEMLASVEDRVASIDPVLAGRVSQRRTAGTKGLFVPLYGHVLSGPKALKEGLLTAMRRAKLGRQARSIERLESTAAQDLAELITECSGKLAQSNFDRLVIIWDEFGRHLQGLIAEGRPEELDALQVLAEVVSRASAVPVSLVLLFHRSLMGYASGLPSGVRREWTKIEGRFDTLQYVDDSGELLELVGSLVEESRSAEPADVDFSALGKRAKAVGLFPDIEHQRLTSALGAAYPLEPATLYLLPRVAARVAQNERTLFSFLQWVSLEEWVPPSASYDYFRGDFCTDAGAGGTQKPWLETESALQKIEAGTVEEEALKCAFLLGLGRGGERACATYTQLAFALNPYDDDHVSDVIDGLIDRKLLIHRRHSDQVVVWHGTDVDLRGRLDDEKKRSADDFRLASFLTREMPPPVWRPVEYNARMDMRRYLTAEYVTVEGLKAFLAELAIGGGRNPGCDGQVLYVLPRGPDEMNDASTIARSITDTRLFVAVANEATALREAALDLWCLLRMHADSDLVGSDPLVKAELDHLTDDARAGLQPLAQRVLLPQRQGSRWFHRGQSIAATSVAQLRRKLSDTMAMVFSLTPEINSEMVVRRSPTSVVVNARKKVELGLLERYGQEDIGIEAGFADRAIFRCVFLRTGLYRLWDDQWRLVSPAAIELPGLAEVWGRVHEFYTMPCTGKSFQTFIDELREPPYGVREGLIPLLLTAGIKAFPTAIAVRHRGSFVDDLLPSVIEDIAKHPGDYELDVVGLTIGEEDYLQGVVRLFRASEELGPVEEGDLLRASMDAVLQWRAKLPVAVSGSRHLSPEARNFEQELSSPDPVRLFLEELPRLIGIPTNQPKKLLQGIAKLRNELESVEQIFQDEAVQALNQTLVSRGIHNGSGVREQASRWACHFPKSFTGNLPDRVTQAVLTRLRSPYRDDASLVNALSTLLVGRPIQQWDDAVVPSFRRQLRNAFEVIEGTALAMSLSPGLDPELRDGLAALAEAKAATIAEQLGDIVGAEAAADRLESIAGALRARTADRG